MGSKKLAPKENNKNMIYNVRIVEDTSKQSVGLSGILFIVFMVVGIYLLFNGKELIEILVNKGDVYSFIKETGKEIIYATGLTFVAFIGNSIASLFKKK